MDVAAVIDSGVDVQFPTPRSPIPFHALVVHKDKKKNGEGTRNFDDDNDSDPVLGFKLDMDDKVMKLAWKSTTVRTPPRRTNLKNSVSRCPSTHYLHLKRSATRDTRSWIRAIDPGTRSKRQNNASKFES